MLIANKNQENIIILNLKENEDIFYLELKNDLTHKVYNDIKLNDLSDSKKRYNMINLILVDKKEDENKDEGKLYINETGRFTFKFFDSQKNELYIGIIKIN